MWAYEPANGSNFGSPGDVLEKCRWCESFCTVVVACNVCLNCSLIDVEFTLSHVIEHCMILRVSRILDTIYRKILASYATWPGVALGMSALEPVETLSDAEPAPPEPKAAAPKKPPAKGKGAAAKTKTASTKTAAKKQKKTAKVPDDSDPTCQVRRASPRSKSTPTPRREFVQSL